MQQFIRHALVAAAVIVPLALEAQARPAASIDPGMSRAQVVERFGPPSGERSRGTFTYLFFVNGREKQVGMSDLVILENDKVVDAVLRSPARTYTGTSSSPRAIPAAEAARGKQSPPPGGAPSPRPTPS